MHPIDAFLARESVENDAGQRKKYTSLHEDFHRALRSNIFPCPPEFMTRRLALIAIHQHNLSHPSSQLTLSSLSTTDTSFLAALSRFHSSEQRVDAIGAAVGTAAKKLIFASEEQQAKAESDLLTAKKLQLALTYMADAGKEILEKELEDDDEDGAEGVFVKLMEKAKNSEDGISELILQLAGKVLDVVGDVEVPDESELDLEREREEEDEIGEGGEETSQSGATCGGVSEDWYFEFLSLSWLKAIDAQEYHEYRVEEVLEFLDRCVEVVGQLKQLELFEILNECQKVVKQARGKEIIDEDDYWPTSEGRSINYYGRPGDMIVRYRRHENLDNGGAIDHRVYRKAQEFIDLVEELTMKSDEQSRPSWYIKDEWHNSCKQKIAATEDIVEDLVQYIDNVENKDLEFDRRVLEALEDFLEQGKGKVDAAAEEELDASLSMNNSSDLSEQGKFSVSIREHCKLLRDEEKQPDPEALRLAQIIIERGNEQYERHHENDDCDCCGHMMGEKLSGGNAHTAPETVTLCTLDLSGGEGRVAGETGSSDAEHTVVDGGTRVLSPIDKGLGAEATSESASKAIQAERHLLSLTEDERRGARRTQ